MIYDPAIHHRRSTRWRGFDYSSAGIYFITVCTHHCACLFGEIVDGEMRLNLKGAIVADAWRGLAGRYPYVRLDEWCVMPNHFHGLLLLTHYFDEGKQAEGPVRGGSRAAPTTVPVKTPIAASNKPLGQLIGAFKTVTTKAINQLRHTPEGLLWQRGYWDRVVRNAREMERAPDYIRK